MMRHGVMDVAEERAYRSESTAFQHAKLSVTMIRSVRSAHACLHSLVRKVYGMLFCMDTSNGEQDGGHKDREHAGQ